MAETPCGSVHESPVRPLPHAPKRKSNEDQVQGIWASSRNFCPRVIDSNLKHWETLLQVTCRGAVPGRKFGLQSAMHFKRVT